MKLGIATIAIALLPGCQRPGLTEEQSSAANEHLKQQLLCVDNAKTIEESRACRCEVEKRYGRPCK